MTSGEERIADTIRRGWGGWNAYLLVGSVGRTPVRIARRVQRSLPELTNKELAILERVYAGIRQEPPDMAPLRAPHHTVSEAAMVGSTGWKARGSTHDRTPGEISLATFGVLYLEDVTRFRPRVLDSTVEAIIENGVYTDPEFVIMSTETLEPDSQEEYRNLRMLFSRLKPKVYRL